MNDEFYIVVAAPCQDIADFAVHLVVMLAGRHQKTILGEFNQYTLEASPGATVKDVLRPRNEAQRRSYFDNPEGTK